MKRINESEISALDTRKVLLLIYEAEKNLKVIVSRGRYEKPVGSIHDFQIPRPYRCLKRITSPSSSARI